MLAFSIATDLTIVQILLGCDSCSQSDPLMLVFGGIHHGPIIPLFGLYIILVTCLTQATGPLSR